MAPENKVWKKKPTKDGRNAKQRRADKKRAIRLASGESTLYPFKGGNPQPLPPKALAEKLLSSASHKRRERFEEKTRIRHQSNRWLSYNLRADDVRGCQNELRWGFKWDTPLCERVERERAEARRAAGVGPDEWVDDWWVERKEGEVLELHTTNEKEKRPEEHEKGNGENPDCVSGIEHGVSRLGL